MYLGLNSNDQIELKVSPKHYDIARQVSAPIHLLNLPTVRRILFTAHLLFCSIVFFPSGCTEVSIQLCRDSFILFPLFVSPSFSC